MDQPTNLTITIKGNADDVKCAALAAQRKIAIFDGNELDEITYEFSDGSDFESQMEEILDTYEYQEDEDGNAEYSSDQESYGCIWQENITEIAEELIKIAPDLEIHISAVITVTYADGYDLCVDIDYVDGKMTVDISEDYYEELDTDEENEFDEDEETDEA